MKTNSEFSEAQKLFLQGHNCAQSVFVANAQRFGIDKETALNLALGMGAGVGRMREVCGAFSACAMLAGFVCKQGETPEERKKIAYEFVQKMAEDFKCRAGSIICREILNLQQGEKTNPTPDVRNAEYYAQRPCLRVVDIGDMIAKKYLKNDF